MSKPDDENLRFEAIRQTTHGLREAIGGLWSMWKAVAGETAESARMFASLLETEADGSRTHAPNIEARDATGVYPKGVPNRIVELRIAITDGGAAEMVRSDLLRMMKGLELMHDVPSYATTWMLTLRDPTESELSVIGEFQRGRTAVGT